MAVIGELEPMVWPSDLRQDCPCQTVDWTPALWAQKPSNASALLHKQRNDGCVLLLSTFELQL